MFSGTEAVSVVHKVSDAVEPSQGTESAPPEPEEESENESPDAEELEVNYTL